MTWCSDLNPCWGIIQSTYIYSNSDQWIIEWPEQGSESKHHASDSTENEEYKVQNVLGTLNIQV